MFSARDKIVKKNKETPTDTEEEVAKALFDLENKDSGLKSNLSDVYITLARDFEFTDRKGQQKKGLLVTIPFKSLVTFRKIHGPVVEELERKFKRPVIVVANRTIISPRAPRHKSLKRPRSRTLTAVHEAILEDIVFPVQIVGKRCRVKTDGSRHYKVFLDPLEKKESVEAKLDFMSHIYQQLATRKVDFVFGDGISK